MPHMSLAATEEGRKAGKREECHGGRLWNGRCTAVIDAQPRAVAAGGGFGGVPPPVVVAVGDEHPPVVRRPRGPRGQRLGDVEGDVAVLHIRYDRAILTN